MNVGEEIREEVKKDRKIVLREERLKEGRKKKSVEVRKLLREVMVKIGLKQKDDKEEIVVKVLLDSRVTGLVTSLEFTRKNKFRKKKFDRLIYVRNVNDIFNHEGPIEHTMEMDVRSTV